MIAYCGLVCTECLAYIATRQDDDEKRVKVAGIWSKQFKAAIKPEDINCDGCLSSGGRLFSHCKVCKIRSCAGEKGLPNCAHCADFACKEVDFILKAVPGAKDTLEEIRKNI